MSSYNFIKNAPKWQENPAYLEHTGNGNSVGSDLDGVDLASDLDALPRMDRPTGNKSAKRGAGKSGLSEEIAPKMLANSSEVALSSRELANQGKEAQATLHKMLDYSILSTNLSSNDEEVRAEFEAERANIICKQRARRAAELGQS
ncbi:uncharacterized protein MELLADRAFT_73224 [Melampsora larici-populina 98AG31]|uniref:No apical meristem-associated C-terminal domain-containing protein n=1 Tax=Melampsora larici-populina (strain 98AG31 / pathotype 3-4-7) TaxID=747676 RepID=F4S529_MELLP|nr:uncharacterized protein MELLADRAFT_73224 [Melampsora larici-populina 98AG31]EGG00247.1 hypothetical protein MELLADRAFT_73224 [Melampsora larici-populina 98AG31]